MSKEPPKNVVKMPDQRTDTTAGTPPPSMRKISTGNNRPNFVVRMPDQRTDITATRPKRKLKNVRPLSTFEEGVLGSDGIKGLRETRDEQDAREVYEQTPQGERRKMVANARRELKKVCNRMAIAACVFKRVEATGEQTISESEMNAVRALTDRAKEVATSLAGITPDTPRLPLFSELPRTYAEAIDALMKAYAQLAEAELRELIAHAQWDA